MLQSLAFGILKRILSGRLPSLFFENLYKFYLNFTIFNLAIGSYRSCSFKTKGMIHRRIFWACYSALFFYPHGLNILCVCKWQCIDKDKQQSSTACSLSLFILFGTEPPNAEPHPNKKRSDATHQIRINRIDRMKASLKTALTSRSQTDSGAANRSTTSRYRDFPLDCVKAEVLILKQP